MATKPNTARARVLSAWPAVNAVANDLIEGDADAIAVLAKAGMVDAEPAAVAYAQSLPGSKIIPLADQTAAAVEVAQAVTADPAA